MLPLAAQKVTDEELKRYVVALDSIDVLKNQLTSAMNKIAKGNENISAQRYALLAPMASDPVKLSNSKASPSEIEYVKRAMIIQRDETAKFQQAYQSIISNYVGDGVFGKVRQALTVDTVLQKRYNSLLKERKN